MLEKKLNVKYRNYLYFFHISLSFYILISSVETNLTMDDTKLFKLRKA